MAKRERLQQQSVKNVYIKLIRSVSMVLVQFCLVVIEGKRKRATSNEHVQKRMKKEKNNVERHAFRANGEIRKYEGIMYLEENEWGGGMTKGWCAKRWATEWRWHRCEDDTVERERGKGAMVWVGSNRDIRGCKTHSFKLFSKPFLRWFVTPFNLRRHICLLNGDEMGSSAQGSMLDSNQCRLMTTLAVRLYNLTEFGCCRFNEVPMHVNPPHTIGTSAPVVTKESINPE